MIDRDLDAGGPRLLLRIPLDGAEDIACLEVQCPSTGKRYFLRVPPQARTSQEAAAWTAGFRNAKHYRPAVET